jgi:two-component system, OmpR family, sensor histidine kinase KdpD
MLEPCRPYDLAVYRLDLRHLYRILLVAIPSLAGATVIVGLLQSHVGVPDASAVYLVAVVTTAIVTGTLGAIVAAVGSFLLYNFLFTEPLYTFTIADAGEWLGVVVLLFVGIVVGQLAALQRSRAEIARAREREARALFRLSRALATRESTPSILPEIIEILGSQTSMTRVWVSLGGDDASERIAADLGDGRPTIPGLVQVLRRMPGDEPAEWVRVHQRSAQSSTRSGLEAYRVRIEAGGAALGSIWSLRQRNLGEPDRTETRLLAAAADQVGQALAHDRLAAESQAAEIARQSDALKSALLQSVSHDLRTPLATIRAAAGTLRPDSALSVEDQRESADAIDREVEYLNRLVTNLLDLSRIEAGALRAENDAFELDDVIGHALERLRPRLAGRTLNVDLDAPPVDVDPILLDEAFTNVVENAIKHTAPGTAMRICAGPVGDGRIRLTIEDAGAGVPADALPRLFDRFYRVPGRGHGSRSGTGIGLAVVRGLTEAMGGQVSARRSELGGLAIDLDLPAAPIMTERVAACVP